MTVKSIDYFEIATQITQEINIAFKQETIVLSNLPAKTWTVIPKPTTFYNIQNFNVYDNLNNLITESFNYRTINNDLQIYSNISLNNLQITYIGN